MPEYQAVIRNKKKGVNAIKKRVFASCFSDAEKIVKADLKKGEYLDCLDSINFSKDKFNIVERR